MTYWLTAMGVYHSKSIDGSNKTRLNDPEIDAFIDKIKATLDPEENVKIVTELSKSLNEICPQVPLYQRTTYVHTQRAWKASQ